MNCQMMRVISSPSSSTTGFATLIFATVGLSPVLGTLERREGLQQAEGRNGVAFFLQLGD
jgi:hypothetical protein